MKLDDGITGIWTYVDIPEKEEFVLVSYGPYQDTHEEEGRSKNKDELIQKAKKIRPRIHASSLRIYNEKRLIVWDALIPTTLPPTKKEYDTEYLKEILKQS